MPFEWNQACTCLDVSWLTTFPSGTRGPCEEVKGDLSKQTDVGVAKVVNKDEGLGIPNSVLLWHWGMVVLFAISFSVVFTLTTPLEQATTLATGVLCSHFSFSTTFPYLTFMNKLMVFWYVWEAWGLGALHGPMHAKLKPPFTDWWYRLTPGTLKLRAPFMPDFLCGHTRNYLDVFVEGICTHVIATCILVQPEVQPQMVYPLFACAFYEFLFDHGQHMSTYGTQLLHVFACMCFPVEQGQVVGMQVFMTWFYFCSGWCKIGQCFKYLNVANLMTSKFMVSTPWAGMFRRLMFKDCESSNPDYHLTIVAKVFSTICAFMETLGPLLCLSNDPTAVCFGIFFFLSMHLYIIATLIVDAFTWNFVDAIYYCMLFGVVHTGFDWPMLTSINPILLAWLVAHIVYTAYGNLVPSRVPYVVAHRHAAGNFAWGVMIIKPEAAAKLAKPRAHAGMPQAIDPTNEFGMRWFGQWLAFHMLNAYLWLWNLPNKMLVPLVEYALDGEPYDSFIIMHSVIYFDALMGHLRFDGLSSLPLIHEWGKVCGFEPGECRLAWVGAFASVPVGQCAGTAEWKLVDAASGVIKQGLYTIADCEDPDYKKPSDCQKLLQKIQDTPDLKTPLLA